MESRVGFSGAVDAMISGAVDATEAAADVSLGSLSPPANRLYRHGINRLKTDRNRNPDRPGPRQLAADNQFAAG